LAAWKPPDLAVWYPDQLRVGLFGQPVMELPAKASLPYIRRNRRFAAGLDDYNQPYGLEFIDLFANAQGAGLSCCRTRELSS
jgi:hypothetical protein